ncbi:hypothetical protein [Urechidicola vernalis]|uniref:Uncharacterized protein n=1 Tax=Urechidicola vernalis TaxID=3075600 RepID=A0ABU2Y1M1_9FLAO|nr:hypothetical protein [Urechidicola sp. P050]MDT0552046.1 hypothetical protein [Urechidicola sp. P050]
MNSRFLIVLVIFPIIGFSQSFELKKPNISKLKDALEQNNSTEIIYAYLLQEYENIGEKKNVKMFEYNKNQICAFEKEFLGGISYTIDECAEEGGITYNITFPRIDKKELMNWVEIMDSNDLSEIENSWNSDGTIYRPNDEGVGCYYTIKETETKSTVEVWCGC